MLSVFILEAEDFGEELYPLTRNILTDLIEFRNVKTMTAIVNGNDMIFQLFCKLAIQYPKVDFCVILSNNALANERNNTLAERSDIIICRKKLYNYAHSMGSSKAFEIMAV